MKRGVQLQRVQRQLRVAKRLSDERHVVLLNITAASRMLQLREPLARFIEPELTFVRP